MERTQAATSKDPSRDRVPGISCHHKDSVTKLINISVDLSMDTRVGCLVTDTARVMVQKATMTMRAEAGRRRPASRERDWGDVRSLLDMKMLAMKERRRLEKPETSMRWAVVTPIFKH